MQESIYVVDLREYGVESVLCGDGKAHKEIGIRIYRMKIEIFIIFK